MWARRCNGFCAKANGWHFSLRQECYPLPVNLNWRQRGLEPLLGSPGPYAARTARERTSGS